MCGIAGFSRVDGTSSIPDGRAFGVDLAHAIRDRGFDAVGFGWFNHAGEAWYWKQQGDPFTVAADAPLPLGLKTLIAHTRWATQGSPKNNANNHPVIAPGIVLVHNGGVWNDDDIFDVLQVERKAEVDSEALAALLSAGPEAFGVDHPAELLSLIEGSAAVAWLDNGSPDVLHLARVSERPLAIGRTRRGDLVFGSTPQALDRAAKWAGLNVTVVESLAEGDYVAVRRGEVIDRRKLTVPAKPKARSWSTGKHAASAVTTTSYGTPKATRKPVTTKPKHRRTRKSQQAFWTPPVSIDRIGAMEKFLRGEGPDPTLHDITKPKGKWRWSTAVQGWVPNDGAGA